MHVCNLYNHVYNVRRYIRQPMDCSVANLESFVQQSAWLHAMHVLLATYMYLHLQVAMSKTWTEGFILASVAALPGAEACCESQKPPADVNSRVRISFSGSFMFSETSASSLNSCSLLCHTCHEF